MIAAMHLRLLSICVILVSLSADQNIFPTDSTFVDVKSLAFTPDGKYFYEKYLRTSTPVLLRGAAKNWAAVSKWQDHAYLETQYGNEIVNATTITSDFDTQESVPQKIQLANFLKTFVDKRLVFDKIINDNSPLLQDINLPIFLQCQELVDSITNLKLRFRRSHEFPSIKRAEFDIFLTAITRPLRVTFFIHKKVEPYGFKNTVSTTAVFPGDILFIPKYYNYFQEDSFITPSMSLEIHLDKFHFDPSKYSTQTELLDSYSRFLSNQPQTISCNLGRAKFTENLSVNFSDPENTPHLRLPKKNSHPDDVTLLSGYTMPVLGLGTGGLKNKTYEAVRNALRIGYRMFDTAYLYENSEAQIGKAVRDSGVARKDVFIVTKLHPRFLGYMETLGAIDESLKRLNMGYIDAFLIHNFACDEKKFMYCEKGEPKGTWKDSWKAMEDAYSLGKLRSLGVSNVEPALLKEIIEFSTLPVSLVQNWFDPLHQDDLVRKICRENGIRYMSYSIFGNMWFNHGLKVNPITVSSTLWAISAHYDFVIYHPILRWAIHKNVTVIPRSSNPIHIAQNYRALDITLFPDDIRHIDMLGDFVQDLMDDREDKRYEQEQKAKS